MHVSRSAHERVDLAVVDVTFSPASQTAPGQGSSPPGPMALLGVHPGPSCDGLGLSGEVDGTVPGEQRKGEAQAV